MIAADLVRGVPDPRPAADPARRSGVDRVRRDGADRRRRRRSSSRRARRRSPTSRRAEELLPANALSSATWSAMLAHRRVDRRPRDGGRPAATSRSSSTRRRSSCRRCFIARDALRRDAGRRADRRAGHRCALTGIADLVEGSATSAAASHVAALMFVKAGWGLAGGVLLLLTIFGQRVFPVGGSTAAGIGVLYGARGIGAGARADRAALDSRPAAAARCAARSARRTSWSASSTWRCAGAPTLLHRGAVRAAARTSADRSSGCSARCCCRWRCRIGSAAASSPRSWRS